MGIKHFYISLMLILAFSGILRSQTYDGYTYYAPQGGNKAYLVDMSGNNYHTWTFTATTTYSSYLLAGGVVLRSVNHAGNSFNGGPISGEVQKVDYNGTVLWDYVYSTTSYCSHHDIHGMPNGNVLLISYERKTASEVTAAGCSQSIEMWPDKIVEIQPSGTNGGTVVWEWHAWDHLVQHFDATKPNYGVVSAHPELLNINYQTTKDWMHMNGIDYNPALDEITFSSHALNEVYVIDHSTTTAQASTHTGGNSGKGGDLLYRWGNPAAYETTGTVDFNVVHDAHWVPATDPAHPNALCGFNNKGGTGGKTCVDIFMPPYNGYNYLLTSGSAYAPTTYDWRTTYSGAVQPDNGNSQQLPNGNTLLCMGMSGFIYEINPSQTQVWSKSTGGTVAQAFRYPPCYVTGTYSATATATPSTIGMGESSQLNVTPTGGVAYTYSWTSVPAGFTSSIQNPVVNPTATTVYNVTIGNGPCSATGTVTVTVNSTPAITATATPSAVCQGGSAQLSASASSGSGYTYSWTSVPAGFTSTLQNPVVTPTVSTTYSVYMTNGTFSGSGNTTVTVNPQISVSATASPAQLCQGESTQLGSTATGGTGITYFWESIPVGFTSTLQNPAATPSGTTLYIVTAGVSCPGKDTVEVVVHPLPSTPVITINGDTLVSSATTGNQWYLNNTLLPGQTSQTLVASFAGAYTVNVTDANGCVSQFSAPVVVEGISADGSSTGYSIYPNPTTGKVRVKADNLTGKNFEIRVYSPIGKLVFSTFNDATIDLSALPEGIYYLRVLSGSTNYLTSKIILIK